MNIKPFADGAAELKWFKSSYSTGEGPQCVEVAASSEAVHVRDSKDQQGPELAFTPAEWSAFVTYAADRI